MNLAPVRIPHIPLELALRVDGMEDGVMVEQQLRCITLKHAHLNWHPHTVYVLQKIQLQCHCLVLQTDLLHHPDQFLLRLQNVVIQQLLHLSVTHRQQIQVLMHVRLLPLQITQDDLLYV